VIEPATPYVDNWHIKTICDYLEACYAGKIKNLIINIPPRCMKSRLVSVFFPAWVWTKDAGKKFIYSSFAENRAEQDSVDCRNLILSEWYQSHFDVKLSPDLNTKTRYKTTSEGMRIAVGVGGGGTGDGGDFVITDDPIKAGDASSDTKRNGVNEWWDKTMSTRLNNRKTGVKIVIMQRLHEDDLTGYLLSKKSPKYEHLCLPMEYEGERFVSSIGFKDPRTEIGQLLWEERFSQEEVQTLKSELGEMGTAGQLQQRPAPEKGFIFKQAWFNLRLHEPEIIARWISWDTASATGKTSAYSACTVGGLMPDYRLLIEEVYREKLEFPQLNSAIEHMAKKYAYKLNGIIIENKSSGISVLQSLAQSAPEEIASLLVSFNPVGSKDERGKHASIWCENGSVVLPQISDNRPWLFDFENELFTYPSSKYKDQVDSFNQLILYLQHFLARGYQARESA